MIDPALDLDKIEPNSRDESYGLPFMAFTDRDHGPATLLFGDVLWHVFHPRSVIEFGCGTGGTLAALLRHGADVTGVDGSEACVPFAARYDDRLAPRIRIHDLRQPFQAPPCDLAVSIEVAEHLPPEAADTFVATVCDAAPVAVITACPPSYREVPNRGHLNEQPFSYWLDKFAAHGRSVDQLATSTIHDAMRLFRRLYDAGRSPVVVPEWYFASHCAVFR